MINLFMDTLDEQNIQTFVNSKLNLAGKRHTYDGDYDEDREK